MRNTLQHPDFVGGSVAIVGIIGIVLGALNLLGSAEAHEDGGQKYPIACCHQMDCAPVDNVEIIPTQKFVAAGMGFVLNLKLPTQTILTTKHGTAVVPENFDQKAIYDSSDGRMHACIRSGKLVCWFRPPGN